jgi:hypothetical protein
MEILTNTVLVGSSNPFTLKDVKKTGGTGRTTLTENAGVIIDDQMTVEAPKMIIFATISPLQPTRISSLSETADRSERLRRYNLNDTFSTSVLLTTIRDIPLEPPPLPLPVELIPAWKLIRPRKPKVLPHAEPIGKHSLSQFATILNIFFQLHMKLNPNVGLKLLHHILIIQRPVFFICKPIVFDFDFI